MVSYILGLDIGSNSIGWALINTGKKPSVIDIGVRVFPKGIGTEKENEKTKCAVRREARGARRVHKRRNVRRDELVKTLRAQGLLPEDEQKLQKLLREKEPYQLRAKGLNDKLHFHEFGRVLFHINQRRGFKSNRKTGEANEKSKIAKGDKQHRGANEIKQVIDEGKFRTVGEYFAGINTEERRIRGQYTFRSMYLNEFNLLWEKQSEYYPDVLTEDLKKKVGDEIIFNQRPMRWDPDTIGYCELEPGEKRCPRGDWHARRLRLLQDVNNLKIRNADGSETKLTDEQREFILQELGKKRKVKFESLKKELSKKGFGLLQNQRFNFEEDSDDNYMNGDGFSEQMRNKKLLGSSWEKLDENLKIDINQALLKLNDEELKRKATDELGFNKRQVEALLEVRLEPGYRRYSKKAILNLLPYLERRLRTDEAKKEAGYEEENEEVDQPYDRLPKPEDLSNPIVMTALNEVRRLTNKIIEKYDKPGKIVIEMARELKNTKKARQKALKQNRDNQKLNEDAEKWLIENTGIKNPKYDDILKYKLWVECDRVCPYTGKSICKTDLFEEPVFQIEHILPHERSGDDSYMNKTLCYVDENVHVKGGKTPFEAYTSNPEKYDEIKHRIACLPQPKRKRFLQEDIPEGHIDRELNDTRYITKQAVKYLKKLGVIVRGTRGTATNALRHSWGLDSIFPELGVARDEDHRRHAVDAVIVAVTTSKHLHELARTKYSKVGKTFSPPKNWSHFREEIAEKVKHINVSHRSTHKVSGRLHEETAYGPTGAKDKKGQDLFVYRKKLEDLTGPMVSKIVDRIVREIVTERLAEYGIDPKKNKKIPKEVWTEPLFMRTKKKDTKVPIKKVRVREPLSNAEPINDQNGRAYRYVKPGNNRHVEIWEYTEGEKKGCREAEIVSMFKAVRRSRAGKPVVRRKHGKGSKFVCSLSINDMVLMPQKVGEVELYRVQKMDINGTVCYRHHCAATLKDNSQRVLQQAHLFKGRKVTVDPLGRIWPAND